jgi:hypothetical protein
MSASSKKSKRRSAKTRPAKNARVQQTVAAAEPAAKIKGWQRIFRPAGVSVAPLPNAFTISRQTALLLASRWRVFGLLTIVYALLTIVFVREFSGGIDVAQLRHDLTSTSGVTSPLAAGGTVLASLASSGGASSATGSTYQLFVWLVISLAAIWALRASRAGEHWRLRDAFYRGMTPLVPFLLVLVVIALQLLPLIVGTGLYSIIASSGIAVNFLELLPWLVLTILLVAISFYWLCSSVVALYVVTLPDMTPLTALRSARDLVRYRRLSVFRKLIFLPIALGVIMAVVMLPFIFVVPVLAQWVFFALSMLALIVGHAYFYVLYRELLPKSEV